MSNAWDDFRAAYQFAKQTQQAADSHADQMASMIVGRLRVSNVGVSTLTALKRELRDFNIHTGRWK